ncbi:MAG: haloacid dehalogenase-like hydrolase [Oscillatoriales cyanobacterium RM2_1_1]|nr:haloacid dehalogenase-like hydrolase [Oscillatoriales cyanobacterium SM2_3_0]NJO45103.1 haloacid dehalogenase-like hydrolase [Oscillatoriales cyanobacterium RM2_1_1]
MASFKVRKSSILGVLLPLFATVVIIFGPSLTMISSSSMGLASPMTPLPSWNDGPTKSAILEFVDRITQESSPDFVPVEDRIATFDNDGTLWAEQPLIQGAFVLNQLQQKAVDDPTLLQQPLIKALSAGDTAYLEQVEMSDVDQLLALLNQGVTDEAFQQDVENFFRTATHPTLKVLYSELTFKPMVELMAYLRANGFQTWICSGGGIDFIRVISEQFYGVPQQQVIGSSLKKQFVEESDQMILKRTGELNSFNDKAVKPVNINLHIGKRPVFAAGNVKSGGDIAMLTYSQERSGPSFQLIVNHDDTEREFAYGEPDNASLDAAKTKNWQVANIKRDWKTVFAYQEKSQ